MSAMMDQFHVLGVSHHNSSLELREKLSFQEGSTKKFLRKLNELFGISESLLVSTCNRTELYYTGDDARQLEIMKLMCMEKDIDYSVYQHHFQFLSGANAVRHLFRVSLGLESKVLGDIQIINQIKKAYQWTADEQLAESFLHRLMHTIFYANKRVIQETAFRDGQASVASVAVGLVEALAETINDPRILLVGTGEVGQNVLENLRKDFTDVTVINRTTERAKQFADLYDYRHASMSQLMTEVNKADVIIMAVSTENALVNGHLVQPSLTQKLFIDLSVPRSVSEDVESVPGSIVYNIDQLREKSSSVLEERMTAKAEVEQILEDHFTEFSGWSTEMEVSPTIHSLKTKLEEIRQQEIKRVLNKLSEEELEMLNKVTSNMIQKVIKLPVIELKAACKRGEAESLIGALNEIFNLEGSEVRKS